ncbi:hypothetical protein CLV48_10539 [Cecembia rubra]|uniref:Uncharacterized protein n=1 Tax=Cecembia rubra TaxID=1485585 RepID=A0A2P8E497_9BACT|nr:hypothetical protein CLV48_10539 [Cecembia rubra]
MKLHKIQKKDFGGQEIYVGIEVHKKYLTIAVKSEFLEHKTFV